MASGDATLLRGIRGLYGDPKYADLKVGCGDKSWKVHKAVVCSQCEFFAKACDGQFQEASSNSINLEEDDPEAVRAMLEYLYTAEYDDAVVKEDKQYYGLQFNVIVHKVADKYGLEGLKTLAYSKFEKRLAAGQWKEIEFSDAIREIYGEGEDQRKDLRSTTMACIMKNGKSLMAWPFFIDVMKEIPSFAAELLCATFKLNKREDIAQIADTKLEPKFTYKCWYCGLLFWCLEDYLGRELSCPKCHSEQTISGILSQDLGT